MSAVFRAKQTTTHAYARARRRMTSSVRLHCIALHYMIIAHCVYCGVYVCVSTHRHDKSNKHSCCGPIFIDVCFGLILGGIASARSDTRWWKNSRKRRRGDRRKTAEIKETKRKLHAFGSCVLLKIRYFYLQDTSRSVIATSGKKVFAFTAADLRTRLWKGHYASAKIMNVQWQKSTRSA